ncbi:MAG: cadherin-like beta sandwich domain-containing protein [Gammaproteobacteria bacterium]|nr:cadherin-like beta sandwich domain-containing protein [Gammaproteobacteria bacterium]
MAPPAQAQSNDATLSIIRSFPGGWTLEPGFQRTRYVYFVRASSHSTRIRVTKSHARATVRITPDDDRSSPDWALFEIGSSVREVQVRVTAEDGNTTRTYRIYFLRDRPVPSHELRLHAGLLLSTLRLSVDADLVAFASGTPTPGDCGCGTEYRVTVPKGTGRISVFAEGAADNVRTRVFLGSRRLGTAVPAATPRLDIETFTVYAQQGDRTEIYDIEVFLAGDPPVLQSVYTSNGNVTLHYDIGLFPTGPGTPGVFAPLASAFTVTSDGTRVGVDYTQIQQNILTLVMQTALDPTTDIRVSYAVPDHNPVRAANRGLAAAFSNRRAMRYGPRISVHDVTVTEGEDETAAFGVSIEHRTSNELRVDYATSDGTATAGADYTATSGTLVIRATDTYETIRVPIIDDNVPDSGETFTLTLSNARGHDAVTIVDATATATINNDDEEEEAEELTAEFRGVPTEHENEEFDVELHFSETLRSSFSYQTLEQALSVTNGELARVSRLVSNGDERNKQWRVQVTPDAGEEVRIDLAASSALSTDDDRELSEPVWATIGAPEPENRPDLTVKFTDGHEPPDTHDGSSEFSFRIEFSDEPHGYSYTTLRDHTLDIRQGSRLTPYVRRVTSGSNRHWEVTVTPTSSADITIRVNETSNCNDDGAVCTEDDRMLLDGIDDTVTGPAGFSVADARVSEGSDVTLDFVVTLSRTPTGTETVDYETIDGTANAGADYTAQSGTLSFSAGTTSMTVSVPVLDDSHDEGEETLTLRLSNASTNVITDNEATGTIENHDPLPQALMARFGRTAAVHVVEQIEERLAAPRARGFDGRIAGRELRRGMGSGLALQFLSELGGNGTGYSGFRGPHTTMPGAGGVTTQAAMPGAVGPMAGPLGARGIGVPALGPRGGVMHPGGAADGAAPGLSDVGLGGEDLLTRSGFALNRQTRGGGMLSFWSRGAQSRFAGQEGDLGLDGNVRTAMFGADYSKGPLVVGLSLANSRGLGSYVGVDLGQIASSVTGLYPWVGYKATERITIWSVAGYGAGGLRLSPDVGAPLESALSMKMTAAGTRGELITGDSGFALSFKADALWVGTAVDGVEGPAGRLAATAAAVSRFRTGLEGSRDYTFAGRVSLKPIVEAGVRHDGGDAETGTGVDVGAGVVLVDSGTGLAVDLRVRMLVMHQAEGFRERGMALSLR